MFSKIVSKLSQIGLTIFFCHKAQNLVYFLPHNFVFISPACSPNTSNNVRRDFGPPMLALVIVT